MQGTAYAEPQYVPSPPPVNVNNKPISNTVKHVPAVALCIIRVQIRSLSMRLGHHPHSQGNSQFRVLLLLYDDNSQFAHAPSSPWQTRFLTQLLSQEWVMPIIQPDPNAQSPEVGQKTLGPKSQNILPLLARGSNIPHCGFYFPHPLLTNDLFCRAS